MPTFSVIVPTAGRATLSAALGSVAPQLEPGDELLVLCNRDRDFGNRARNDLISRARGTHLVFVDDDDEMLPGALARVRRWAEANPARVGIFKQVFDLQPSLPRVRELWDTGSPCYVVPNLPGKLGRFIPPPEEPKERWADVMFIRTTCELQGEPVFVEEAISIFRPEKSRLRRLRWKIALRTRLRRLLARTASLG